MNPIITFLFGLMAIVALGTATLILWTIGNFPLAVVALATALYVALDPFNHHIR